MCRAPLKWIESLNAGRDNILNVDVEEESEREKERDISFYL